MFSLASGPYTGPRDRGKNLDKIRAATSLAAMSQSFPRSTDLDLAVADVRKRSPLKPKVALVLGSGLGGFADSFNERVSIPYDEIRGMPASRVPGHAGRLVLGSLEGKPVVAMQGRVHLYEGHSVYEVVHGVRVMLRLGADVVVVTNAAGGIDATLEVGDLMVIDDQINLTGSNPLIGPNDDALGLRFVDMTTAYDRDLRHVIADVAREQDLALKRGVYAGLLGPTYETPAEIRMLRALGASAVGMSTVLEVIAARHMKARVLGVSCITNLAAGLGNANLTHEEVQETADRVQTRFRQLLSGVVRRIT